MGNEVVGWSLVATVVCFDTYATGNCRTFMGCKEVPMNLITQFAFVQRLCIRKMLK
jgi:hypothetical protein